MFSYFLLNGIKKFVKITFSHNHTVKLFLISQLPSPYIIWLLFSLLFLLFFFFYYDKNEIYFIKRTFVYLYSQLIGYNAIILQLNETNWLHSFKLRLWLVLPSVNSLILNLFLWYTNTYIIHVRCIVNINRNSVWQ